MHETMRLEETPPRGMRRHSAALAFDVNALEAELALLIDRYGVPVGAEITDLRGKYGDQCGDRIRVSRYIADTRNALDTVRHEYAHAVADRKRGSKDGHGRLWKKLAAEMGARPSSRGRGMLVNVPLREPQCLRCRRRYLPLARVPRRARCPGCGHRKITWTAIVGVRFQHSKP